nr:midasin isoform X14 [Tanacetum cinerariifolium]
MSIELYPYGITKQMEQFVQHNFLLIRDFKEQLQVIRKQDVHAGLAKYFLLDHIEDIFIMGNLLDEYYNSALEASIPTTSDEFPLPEDFPTASEERFPLLSNAILLRGSWYTEFPFNSFHPTELIEASDKGLKNETSLILSGQEKYLSEPTVIINDNKAIAFLIHVGNKMLKAFPLPVISSYYRVHSHCYEEEFPLLRECRAPRSQEKGRRENYRQGSKEEEQAPKALMAIDGVGWDWSFMANEEENHANEVFDNSLCSKACKKNTDSLNSKITKISDKLYDSKTMLYHYKLGLSQVEDRLVEFKLQEIKFCEKIRGLKLDLSNKNFKIEHLTNELEQAKKEKGDLDSKLTGFQSASKDLDNLLGSQRNNKNKEGLGYSVVPPPLVQVYSPPKKDMSWIGLPEFEDDTITDYSRPSPAIESNLDDLQNKNISVTETGASSSTILSKPAISFVKSADRPTETKTNKFETTKKPAIKYVELYRKTSKSSNEPMEDQPLPADVSPTAISPGYVVDSDPEKDENDLKGGSCLLSCR